MTTKDILLAQFDLHTLLFNNTLNSFTDEQANKRALPGINHVKWLAGHLLAVRVHMGKLAGKDLDFGWSDIFSNGSSAQDDTSIYPTLDAIRDLWNDVTPSVREVYASCTDEQLAAPSPFSQPCGTTFVSMWAFLEHHQAYTIGQVSLVRRMQGLEAMKYD